MRALVERSTDVQLATQTPNGSASSVVVWAGAPGRQHQGRHRQPDEPDTVKNVARNRRAAISMTDHENPYRTASVRGRVVGCRTGPDAREAMDRLAPAYAAGPVPWRTDQGILCVIDPGWSRFADLRFSHNPV